MASDRNDAKPKLVGINHVALEVADIEQALAFYGGIFEFELRGRHEGMAFIDMGDQFIALAETGGAHRDDHRHFGLVVDDKKTARAAIEAAGVEILPGGFLDFLDPWGNRVQIVEYSEIQFAKTPPVLDHMKLGHLEKSAASLEELARKGIRTADSRS